MRYLYQTSEQIADLDGPPRDDGYFRQKDGCSVHRFYPLNLAARKGLIDVVQFLVANGMDVNEGDKEHQEVAPFTLDDHGTPLHNAASEGRIEIAKWLLANGANVNAQSGRFFRTPLHRAARNDSTEMAKLLLANGAGVNAIDKNGWRPLHDAAIEGRKDVAELLISKGADINAMSYPSTNPLTEKLERPGETPLGYVSEDKHPELAELLRRLGGHLGSTWERPGATSNRESEYR